MVVFAALCVGDFLSTIGGGGGGVRSRFRTTYVCNINNALHSSVLFALKCF